MSNISIAPLYSTASRNQARSSSTAIATIDGGVEYRSSGMTDADVGRMTKAMHDHRRLLAAWEAFSGRLSSNASGSAFRWFCCRREYTPSRWGVDWLALFQRATQVLGSLESDAGARPAAAHRDRASTFFTDAATRQWLATMRPALSLKTN